MSRPLIWLPLRSWWYDSVSGLAVTKNIGSVAPTVQLSDGATVGTFPTQLGPSTSVRKGMVFSGAAGVNLRCLTDIPSLSAVTAVLQFYGLEKVANYMGLLGKALTATQGWAISAELSGAIRIPTFYCRGTNQYVSATGVDIADGGLHTLIGIYDGANASICLDGRLIAGPTAKTNGLDGGGTTTFVGGDGPVFALAKAKILHASVWPFGFTPQQAKVMHNRLMSEIST